MFTVLVLTTADYRRAVLCPQSAQGSYCFVLMATVCGHRPLAADFGHDDDDDDDGDKFSATGLIYRKENTQKTEVDLS